MPADPFRPDHLEEVLGGRTAPRTDAEREALRYSQLLPRLTPRGPSTGATRQMRGRFEAFLERGGRPRGFAGLLPPWLATPAMQRLAAGAVLLVGLWLSYRLVNIPSFADFLISVEAEMNKVSWPTWPELVRSTLVVIFVIVTMALLLYAYDFFWVALFKALGVLYSLPNE